MKSFLMILFFTSLTIAKPNMHPKLSFTDGKIIGGSDAPKRTLFQKYYYYDYFSWHQIHTFPAL